MTRATATSDILSVLDPATRALARLSAVVTAGTEQEIHDAIALANDHIPAGWVDELLLQSYLFAGFPRALNAMRAWRRFQPQPVAPEPSGEAAQWRSDGAVTCAAVYGTMYERLRENIRALHPLLDDWMITEGYGKVMSRPGLDLARRELCVMAACAAANQDRQLLSHLNGALNVGVAPAVVTATIEAIADLLGADRARSVALLWARVQRKQRQ
jgi:4-carboxymuconolactone decarboxylase